jgi:hypothetical protein
MATTPPSTELQPIERDILDHFKEGVGVRTIALRASMEYTDVQQVITETCGGDRSRAAALVAAWDRRHPDHTPVIKAPPAGAGVLPAAGASAVSDPPRRRPERPVLPAAKRPRVVRAETAPREEPAAPTVEPVDLTDSATAAAPDPIPAELGAGDQPAEAEAPRAEDLPLDPPPAEAGDQGATDDDPETGDVDRPAEAPPAPVVLPHCTHGGDCTLHPDARGIHDFSFLEREAAAEDEALLDGPTEDLPDVASFEELMAAAQRSGDVQLDQLAREVSAAVDELHATYARERTARRLRGEAAILRRELATRVAQLRRLAAGDDPAATAAAGDQDAGETSHQHRAAA